MASALPPAGFRAVVFDFDGTILDTETPVYDSACEMYLEHGLVAPSRPDWVASIGHTTQPFDIYEDVAAKADAALDIQQLRDRRSARTREMVKDLDYRPGIMHWLETAEAVGSAVAIASSSPIWWVHSTLEERNLTDRFPVVSCAGDGVPGKPDPSVYRIACQKLGVDPADAIAIEDSPTGAKAAVDAGLWCLAVPGPMTSALDYSVAHTQLFSLADADPVAFLRKF